MKRLTILLVLLCMASAYALEVYVRPPKMIARINLTETDTWQGFIEVKNKNNETVNVTFKPVGNISQLIAITNKVQLQPGELQQQNFTIKVQKPGTYEGGVIVTYSKEGEVPVALQADITVIATGEKAQEKAIPYLYLLLPLLLALIVAYVRWKK